MGIISANKSTGGDTGIPGQGTVSVTLGINAAPDIAGGPTEIVLILDRSGSVEGQPPADRKAGVNALTESVPDAAGGADGQEIGLAAPAADLKETAGGPAFPADGCPEAVDVAAEGCGNLVEVSAGDLPLEGAGRILQLDVNLLNVCPGRRVALAVVLTELENGVPVPRGMKTFTIPAHDRPACADVLVTCIRFILPEGGNGPWARRELQARFMAHYIDGGLSCCAAPPAASGE